MTENASNTDKKRIPGAIIGLLAGLWGMAVVLLITISQIRMISPGTPLNVVLQSNGLGFLYLGMYLVAFALLIVFCSSALGRKPDRNAWPDFFIVVSILFIGLSFLPGSTTGLWLLPAAVGMLVSGVGLRSP